MSAYTKYARSKSIKGELLDSSNGHFVVMLKGKKAWSAFKDEAGKHCIQRIPPTEKRGRPQTSFVSVGVLPVPPKEDSLPESEIIADVDVKTQGGHGKGGQHQNVTDSAVRMTHKPTGLRVFINGRSQTDNRREALRILTAKVNAHLRDESSKAYGKERKNQMGDGGRGDKIRTYNLIDGRAVDHRSGKRVQNAKKILRKGDFDSLK